MRTIRLATCLAVAALLGLCTVARAADMPQRGGALRYGMVTEVSSLDPHVYVGSSWKVLNHAFYDSLIGFDTTGKLVPALAEAWETADARTYVFRLRKGVTFHKGQPFTARDVKFSIERILDPATGATLRSNLLGTTVTVIDDHTVRIERDQPDASLVNVLAMPEAAIVSEAWMKGGPNIKAEANGTGPFVLAEYEPKVRAVAQRNPAYRVKGQPYLDRVTFQMISNGDARVNALRTGALDMIEFVPWKDIDSLERQSGLEVQTSGGAFMNIWFNTAKKPLDDPRVRRAVAYAIDREAVSRAAFFGHGTPLYGPPTTADSPYYVEDLARHFSHDPKKAKALLAEAGYANGLDLGLLVYQGLAIYTSTAQIVQANLKDVGINATIKLVEWPIVIESKDKGNYEMMIYGVNVKLPDPDVYAYYFGSESTYWAKPIGFSDGEIEALLKKGRALTNLAERRKVYRSLEARVLELSPWAFVNWRDQAQAYRKSVRGYTQLGGALSESSPGIAMPTMWLSR